MREAMNVSSIVSRKFYWEIFKGNLLLILGDGELAG